MQGTQLTQFTDGKEKRRIGRAWRGTKKKGEEEGGKRKKERKRGTKRRENMEKEGEEK